MSHATARGAVYRIPIDRDASLIRPRTALELAAVVASGSAAAYAVLTDEDRRAIVAALEGLAAQYPELPALLIVNEYDEAGRLAGLEGNTLRNAVRALWPGWSPPRPPDAATITH